MRRHLILGFALSLGVLFTVGCSDDTQDEAREAAESAADDARDGAEDALDEAEEATQTAGAQAAARAMQVTIQNDDRYDDEGPRSIAVLEDSRDNLPNDGDVEGISDDDGDGLDDDGLVQVQVGDEAACLELGETEGVRVADGPCDFD
jgi:hypothetical protein